MIHLPAIFPVQGLLPKMKIKRTREELRALAKVSNKCSLVSLFMSNCNVERTIDAMAYKKIDVELDVNGSLLKKEGKSLFAKASMILRGVPPESKKDHVIKIACEYVLKYKLEMDKDASDEDLGNFCNINALYNAWPFFREFALNMTNRMEIPPLTLPLMSISALPVKKKDEGEPSDRGNQNK
jgi:hypothetical protein